MIRSARFPTSAQLSASASPGRRPQYASTEISVACPMLNRARSRSTASGVHGSTRRWIVRPGFLIFATGFAAISSSVTAIVKIDCRTASARSTVCSPTPSARSSAR